MVVELWADQGLNSPNSGLYVGLALCEFGYLFKLDCSAGIVGRMNVQRTPYATMQGNDEPINNDDDGKGTGTSVITKVKPKVKKPSLYRVLLLNDDFTPMEFVVEVLARFFQMDLEAATQVMLHVHQNGVGECGVYTYEVAETKVTQVMDFARQNQHPLQCIMEKK